MSFLGYKLGSGGEKAGGAGREARKSMEGRAGWPVPFPPCPPCLSEAGRKISLSYTMTYEAILPAPPAPRKFLSLNRRKPAPLSTSSFFASLNYEEAGGAGRIAS